MNCYKIAGFHVHSPFVFTISSYHSYQPLTSFGSALSWHRISQSTQGNLFSGGAYLQMSSHFFPSVMPNKSIMSSINPAFCYLLLPLPMLTYHIRIFRPSVFPFAIYQTRNICFVCKKAVFTTGIVLFACIMTVYFHCTYQPFTHYARTVDQPLPAREWQDATVWGWLAVPLTLQVQVQVPALPVPACRPRATSQSCTPYSPCL